MSYHIYQTEGIILGRTETGEADGIFDVLTRDFGRINVLSQGVRYLKSKLRYNLKTFAYSRLGLVAGVKTPDFWRLVDAQEIENFPAVYEDAEKSAAAGRIADMIKRMLAGPYPDPALWKEVKNIFSFLAASGNIKKENLVIFELLAKLRLLSRLGYAEDREKWLSLNIEKARGMESVMSSAIEKSLEASQL